MGMLHTGQGKDTYGGHSCIMGGFAGLRHYSAPVNWSAGQSNGVQAGPGIAHDTLSSGTMIIKNRRDCKTCDSGWKPAPTVC
jgi:hypothetical protein